MGTSSATEILVQKVALLFTASNQVLTFVKTLHSPLSLIMA